VKIVHLFSKSYGQMEEIVQDQIIQARVQVSSDGMSLTVLPSVDVPPEIAPRMSPARVLGCVAGGAAGSRSVDSLEGNAVEASQNVMNSNIDKSNTSSKSEVTVNP